jgi:formate-dependent nitrite reductase cytochrome c552 subunit
VLSLTKFTDKAISQNGRLLGCVDCHTEDVKNEGGKYYFNLTHVLRSSTCTTRGSGTVRLVVKQPQKQPIKIVYKEPTPR